MTEETKGGASGGEISWTGVERRRAESAPEAPSGTFLPVPADWQHRGMAFLIDMSLYATLHFGGPALGFGILGGFLGVLFITFRDGLFGGQSVGKKILGIRVVHMDGRPISYIDSSFRNVLFIIYLLIPAAIVVEAVAAYMHPQRRRLGDRIAKTCVVQKERIPVLA
jgi:uncharacterized RDD family membrane protein YckC